MPMLKIIAQENLVVKIPLSVISFIFSYYGLKLTAKKIRDLRIKSRRRIQYVDYSTEDGVKLRSEYREFEIVSEAPRKQFSTLEDTDELFFYGIDNKSHSNLSIQLKRTSKNDVEAFVVLNLKYNGAFRKFRLLTNKFVEKFHDDKWKAGDLHIWRDEPNRSYRISFNGLMRDEEKEDVHHVILSIRWKTLNDIFDYHMYANKSNSAFMNQYNNVGVTFGTYKINDEDEKEIYFWGGRNRKLGRSSKAGEISRLWAYFENGTAIEITYYKEKGNKKTLIGSLTWSAGFTVELNLKWKQTINFIEQAINEGMATFNFSADGCRFEMFISVEKCKDDPQIHESTYLLKNLTHGWTYRGRGFVHVEELDESKEAIIDRPLEIKSPIDNREVMVVDIFQHEFSENGDLLGGKGSSLVALHKMAHDMDFQVPRAIFVTVNSFESHLKENENLQTYIENLNESVNSGVITLETASETICNLFENSEISKELKSQVEHFLKKVFGHNYENDLFSVRSSAIGEDGKEMSFAGQMDTYLGVKSFDDIISSIKKCWASCYSLRAMQYRRQYGQLLTTGMSVVVQEMVNADSAGVMFTRDPITGNPSKILISSNFGLGESVVNGSCEPDSILLEENAKSKEFKIIDYKVGKKSNTVLLNKDDGGVVQAMDDVSNKDEKSLSKELAIRLGKLGKQIEALTAEPKDIEWSTSGNSIYLLQARPITTLNKETDFDIIHEFDTPLQTDHECLSSGNIREVLPTATSPITKTFSSPRMVLKMMAGMRWMFPERGIQVFLAPYRDLLGHQTHGHSFMPRTNNTFNTNSLMQEWSDVTMNGRVVLDDSAKIVSERFRVLNMYSPLNILKTMIGICKMYFYVKHVKKILSTAEVKDFDTSDLTTIEKTIGFLDNMFSCDKTGRYHNAASLLSSWSNFSIIKLLIKYQKGNTNWTHISSDLAKLLEHCSEEGVVESVDVPQALQVLVKQISKDIDPQKFSEMSAEQAYEFITADGNKSKQMFDDLIKRHGHRCINEFDVSSEPWELYPMDLVECLQQMAKNHDKLKEKKVFELETVLDELITPLKDSDKKTLLTYAKSARLNVGYREKTKSLLIRSIHTERKVFLHLADQMLKSGMLPDKKLLFFFKYVEIKQFVKTRSPSIIQRAMKRRRIQPYLETLEFAEFVVGIPKPLEAKSLKEENSQVNIKLSGTPVCHGIVKAKVRVAKNLKEAKSLKIGEILVAKSTDIAWSPFFPIASGIITEIGGLISHGAVVAREYGLPCLINVIDATSIFKTGDMVILDGKAGTIERIVKAE